MTEEEPSCKKICNEYFWSVLFFFNSKRGQEDPGGASFIKHVACTNCKEAIYITCPKEPSI
jgi:hypothetical protein